MSPSKKKNTKSELDELDKYMLGIGIPLLIAGIVLIVLLFLDTEPGQVPLETVHERTAEDIRQTALIWIRPDIMDLGVITELDNLGAGGKKKYIEVTGTAGAPYPMVDMKSGDTVVKINQQGAKCIAALSTFRATNHTDADYPVDINTPFTVVACGQGSALNFVTVAKNVANPEYLPSGMNPSFFKHSTFSFRTLLNINYTTYTPSLLLTGKLSMTEYDQAGTRYPTFNETLWHTYVFQYSEAQRKAGDLTMHSFVDPNVDLEIGTGSSIAYHYRTAWYGTPEEDYRITGGTTVDLLWGYTTGSGTVGDLPLYGDVQVYDSYLPVDEIQTLCEDLWQRYIPPLTYNDSKLTLYAGSPTSIVPLGANPGGYAIRFTPALPPGLNIDGSTGEIHGTPLYVQDYVSYVGKVDGAHGFFYLDIQITESPVMTYAPIYNVIQRTLGTTVPNFENFTPGPGDVFTISPPLPQGLFINAATGVISGYPENPSVIAVYTVTCTVASVPGLSQITGEVYISVIGNNSDRLNYPDPFMRYAQQNIFYDDEYISITPETDNVMNVLTTEVLPAGLTLDDNTGTISGFGQATKQKSYPVIGTSLGGGKYAQVIGLRVDSRIFYSDSQIAYVGYDFTLTPTAKPEFTHFTISKSLPAGLKFDKRTGRVSGTPTEPASKYRYNVYGLDGAGAHASGSFELEVLPTKSINKPYLGVGLLFMGAGMAMTSYVWIKHNPEGKWFSSKQSTKKSKN